VEVVGREGLGRVGAGAARIGVRLDEQPVGAGGEAGQGERRDQRAGAGRVRRIDEDGGARGGLRQRDRRDVEGVARPGLEGADAALAQDQRRAAGHEEVLGGEEPLGDGGAGRSLEQHRASGGADLAEQAEALPVARADLEEIDRRGGLVERRLVDDLDDDRQADLVGGGAEGAQRRRAAPLEAVRRGPGLPDAAAEEASARRVGRARRGDDDVLALDGAGPRGEEQLARADDGAADDDLGGHRGEARVGRGGREDVLDAGEGEEAIARHVGRDLDGHAAEPLDAAGGRAEPRGGGLDGADLRARRAGGTEDDHAHRKASRQAQTPNSSET
jgi:hypothetical protein